VATGFAVATSVRELAGAGGAAFVAGAGAVTSTVSSALAAFSTGTGTVSGIKRKVR